MQKQIVRIQESKILVFVRTLVLQKFIVHKESLQNDKALILPTLCNHLFYEATAVYYFSFTYRLLFNRAKEKCRLSGSHP